MLHGFVNGHRQSPSHWLLLQFWVKWNKTKWNAVGQNVVGIPRGRASPGGGERGSSLLPPKGWWLEQSGLTTPPTPLYGPLSNSLLRVEVNRGRGCESWEKKAGDWLPDRCWEGPPPGGGVHSDLRKFILIFEGKYFLCFPIQSLKKVRGGYPNLGASTAEWHWTPTGAN